MFQGDLKVLSDDEKMYSHRRNAIIHMDLHGNISAIESAAREYEKNIAITKAICPPFRITMKSDFMEIMKTSASLSHLLRTEPRLTETIIHDIVYDILLQVLSQSSGTDDASTDDVPAVQREQVQLSVRVTSIPNTWSLTANPTIKGLVAFRGVLTAHSAKQKYLRSAVWCCPEECNIKLVTNTVCSVAPRCRECSTVLTKLAACMDMGDVITALVLPSAALETPHGTRDAHPAYYAITVRISDELTNNLEIGTTYKITGVFECATQIFDAWNVEVEKEASEVFAFDIQNAIESYYKTLQNNENLILNSPNIQTVENCDRNVFSPRDIFSQNDEKVTNKKSAKVRTAGYLFSSIFASDFDDDILDLDYDNQDKIINYKDHSNRINVQEISTELIGSPDTFMEYDSIREFPLNSPQIGSPDLFPSQFKPKISDSQKNYFDQNKNKSKIVNLQHSGVLKYQNLIQTSQETQCRTVTPPPSIYKLKMLLGSSPYMFVHALAAQLGRDFIPMGAFIHLKMGLLLSIATIQNSGPPPLHVLSVGTDTLVSQKLMTKIGNIAKRLVIPLEIARGGVARKDGWYEGGPLLLAREGVCLIGDWSKYNRGKCSESVVTAMESGKVHLDIQAGSSIKTPPACPLHCAIWSYWAPPHKSKDKSQLTTLLNIFGICFVSETDDMGEVIKYMLEREVRGHIRKGLTIDELDIPEADLKQYLQQVSKTQVEIEPQAETMIREYFVACRRARPECFSLRGLTILTQLSEAHARLAMRNVTKYDVIVAIYICETSINALSGPASLTSPPTPAIKDIAQVDEHMAQFEIWLEQYVSSLVKPSYL